MRTNSNLTDVIDLMDAFAADSGQVYAHIPVLAANGVVTHLERAVEATDFQSWVRAILHESLSKIPSDKDVANALDVIRGYALERPRRAPKNPVQPSLPALKPFGQVL